MKLFLAFHGNNIFLPKGRVSFSAPCSRRICIGDNSALYYCFPKSGGDIVAKTRLAAEELYKLKCRTAQR